MESELEMLKSTTDNFLYNALVFHIAAQSSYLSSNWNKWLEKIKESEQQIPRAIIDVAKKYCEENNGRPYFRPDWYLNYESGVETIWYRPYVTRLKLSSGAEVYVKGIDELAALFHLIEENPDYLVC